VSQFDGHFPVSPSELRSLPGIGRYTAGAIASIAYGERAAVVDGNVGRVLCRLFRLPGDPKSRAVQKQLWSLAEELLPTEDVGSFNQALMELGSEICLPRNPRCDACPVTRWCEARRHGEQNDLPQRASKKPLPCYVVAVAVIYRDGRILIDKRRPEGLLGGLWEFPGGKVRPGESLESALHREVREELGIEVRVDRPLAVIDHAYSHFRVRLHAFACTHAAGEPVCATCTGLRWVRPRDLGRYAFPAANKRIIRALHDEALRR
jgi:A/G-specific adenine glycosylase